MSAQSGNCFSPAALAGRNLGASLGPWASGELGDQEQDHYRAGNSLKGWTKPVSLAQPWRSRRGRRSSTPRPMSTHSGPAQGWGLGPGAGRVPPHRARETHVSVPTLFLSQWLSRHRTYFNHLQLPGPGQPVSVPTRTRHLLGLLGASCSESTLLPRATSSVPGAREHVIKSCHVK